MDINYLSFNLIIYQVLIHMFCNLNFIFSMF